MFVGQQQVGLNTLVSLASCDYQYVLLLPADPLAPLAAQEASVGQAGACSAQSLREAHTIAQQAGTSPLRSSSRRRRGSEVVLGCCAAAALLLQDSQWLQGGTFVSAYMYACACDECLVVLETTTTGCLA